ncbi:NnrS family protein [Arhodomonas sp. AD133]|uniref:NnrS family protein n=1 Tax=Arhodomonas sp. AD133 TaxID=3415009 RepID=UPI003EC021FC
MSETDPRSPSRTSRRNAQGLFFPAAAAYTAVVAPLSVHGMWTGNAVVPAFTSATGHAHELLFGFALAVITGFLINRATRFTLGTLFALWSGGRLAFLLAPGSFASAVLNAGFAVCLATIVVPPFMKAAKKWRNQAIGPILLATGGALLVFHLAQQGRLPALGHLALREAVLVLALLMLFMGGRIIAPAAARHIQTRGEHLDARVQPRLEGALLLLIAAAIVTAPLPRLAVVAGVALIAAGAVALVRLVRWRLWWCADRDDLTGLGVGYAWLAVGLLLVGSALAGGVPAIRTALHAITVGALGTLSITVMVRTAILRAKRDPARLPGVPPAVVMIAAAAVLRIGWPATPSLMMAASLLWSAAFAIVLVTLVRTRMSL